MSEVLLCWIKHTSEFSLLGCMQDNLAKVGDKDVLLAVRVTLSASGESCWVLLVLEYWSVPAAGKPHGW